jgi:predicted ATP-dependent protease
MKTAAAARKKTAETGARHLAPSEVALPSFTIPDPAPETTHIFELSSHARAREALAFGLRVPDAGFNIFVLGEDRSGRMTAALQYINEHARGLPRLFDWVYLNNFRRPHKPKPYRLPPGVGRRFRERMAALVPALRKALAKEFATPEIAERVERQGAATQHGLEADFAELQRFARERGVDLERSPKGILARPAQGHAAEDLLVLSLEERTRRATGYDAVRERVEAFKSRVRTSEATFAGQLDELRHSAGEEAIGPLLDELEAEFGNFAGLARWLVELRADLAENIDLLVPSAKNDEVAEGTRPLSAEERYAVNLIVDHGDEPHPQVVLEPNPTYENLFGTIEYRSVNGVAETDFTLIRSGALHRANGSVLVLRAEALAQRVEVWGFLKGALRDGVIRIEEPHRQGGTPMAGAPLPKPIPLKVKVVIVGAPRWYYTVFSNDPEFATYFKVKADIDPDMPADERNVAVYAGLIAGMARRQSERGCNIEAVQRLLGESTRWAGDRTKLSARFELIEDVIAEATAIAKRGEPRNAAPIVTAAHVRRALLERRQRNARVEDRSHESIRDGVVMIDTEGTRIGQINALTIRDLGDYDFGLPARVTARVFVGRHGIMNIERSIDLGGPIQQKGVFIIGGYLNGRFARRYPLCFSATLTFEQSYGGVEGDSASMAELLAILSALADTPLRQDVAVTGSVNQNGESQAVGGIHRKIEGFYRTCAERGLTGKQGVLIPRANERNLVLEEEVGEAVTAGRFHIWSMRDVDDALELLTGSDPGRPGEVDTPPPGSVAARIQESLDRFDVIMRERTSSAWT